MRRNVILFLILTVGLIQMAFAQETIPVSNAKGYLLGPGDEIVVKVLGEKDFDFEAAVDENGNIEVPFFDKPVMAMCRSERDLRSEVTKALGKYLKNPQVSLRIKERKSRPPTTIYGSVKAPQQIILMRPARLSELLALVGGETEDAGGIIQVVRPQPPMCGSADEISEWKAQSVNSESYPMRLYSLSSIKKNANDNSNPIMYPGDIISIESAKPVYLVGEVKGGQGGLYIKENGLTLFNAIAMVGGVSREAKTKDIKIYRQKPDSIDREILSVNYELIQKGQQKDIALEPYDIIEVDKAKKPIGQIILELAVGAGKTAFQGITTGVPQRILY